MNDDQQLSRSLKNRHIQLIAIGGAIGTGLFLGSGTAIHEAGPSIILSYLITGIICFFLMRSVGELLLSDTRLHSFIDFVGRYLGNRFEFVLGWTYWFCWISIAMADLTASGIYIRFWFPHFPQWATPLLIIVLLLLVNLANVDLFGEMESWFSMIKVVAILLLIVIGLYLIGTNFTTPNTVASFSNLYSHGGVFPTGIKGFMASFQMIVFAFVGIEMVGITAGETESPEKNLPKAVNSLPLRIGLFYIGSMIIIMSVYPWNKLAQTQSPFVQMFADIGINAAAGVVNFVVLTAALSACNSAIFTTSRTLWSLAKGHNASQRFKHVNKNHVPQNALLLSSAALLIVVVLNYVMPKDVFSLISGVATVSFLFVWSVLIITHLVYRRKNKESAEHNIFPAPFYPYADYIALAFYAIIFVILFFSSSMRLSLYVSVLWIICLFLIYEVVKKVRRT
ncbi:MULTISPECIES: amino acid permease [Levilactobacillus]|uniref:Amino acid permease n=1 Tax=Levilactobacillus tongjiangensis TaxID=2486023 RepID=A0ABW1SQT5_9LACO|nr:MULTISPECIES: amino acid permease [Levilactobacillus]